LDSVESDLFLNGEKHNIDDISGFSGSQGDTTQMYTKVSKWMESFHYEKCIYYLLSFLQQKIKLHGKIHPFVSVTLHNLAVLSIYNNQFTQALKYAMEALCVQKSLLDSSDIKIALSLSEVAIILYALQHFESSLASFREALQIMCKAVGYDHPSVAKILNNIACVHFEMKKFASAHATFDESLEIQRVSMGGEESNVSLALCKVAVTLCNVALVHFERGEINECVEIMDEALMVQESVLGDDHDIVYSTRENLRRMNPIDQEENRLDGEKVDSSSCSMRPLEQSSPPYLSPSLKINPSAMFGECDGVPKRHLRKSKKLEMFDGIDVISLGPLSLAHTSKQRVRRTVLAGFRMCNLNTKKNCLKVKAVPHSPESRVRISFPVDIDEEQIMDAELHLEGVYGQAVEHLEHGEHAEALELFELTLRSHEEKYGHNHHLVGTALHSIGILHLFSENYEKAFPCFEEAVQIRRSVLGPDHPDVSASLGKAAIVLFALHQFDASLSNFCSALSLLRRILGYSNHQVAKILNNIGCVHYEYGGLLAALKAFEEALEIQEELILSASSNESRLNLAGTMCNIGFILVKRKEYGEAIVVMNKALKIIKEVLGNKADNDERVQTALGNLAYAMAFANSQCEEEDEGISEMIEMYTEMLRG